MAQQLPQSRHTASPLSSFKTTLQSEGNVLDKLSQVHSPLLTVWEISTGGLKFHYKARGETLPSGVLQCLRHYWDPVPQNHYVPIFFSPFKGNTHRKQLRDQTTSNKKKFLFSHSLRKISNLLHVNTGEPLLHTRLASLS